MFSMKHGDLKNVYSTEATFRLNKHSALCNPVQICVYKRMAFQLACGLPILSIDGCRRSGCFVGVFFECISRCFCLFS